MSAPRRHNRRSYFRLRYPRPERPTLRVNGHEIEVLDLSESGARLAVDPDCGLTADQPFAGTVRFPSGESVEVQGKTVRVQGGEAAVRFTAGVPLRVMVAEQRRLIRRYPDYFSQAGEA